MRAVTLKRIAKLPGVTFGVLLDGSALFGAPFAVTVERPWKDNRRGESCIPAGSYVCRRILSPRFGHTFEVNDVPGRSAILFHKGNLAEDSHGCIIVGEAFNAVSGGDGVTQSGAGFGELMARLKGYDEFTLTVMEV